MSEVILQAQGLCKRFQEGGLDVSVLDGVDVSMQRGQTLAIVGASGCGKSTLLHLLGGLDEPSRGKVSLMGRAWSQMSPAEQSMWRNQHLGFVYQFHHLLPEFSALDNVAMPLLIRRCSLAHAHEQARLALDKVGLAARAAHRPGQLSGGERQRVAVARALVATPVCLLADEPTGNLDRDSAHLVLELMLELAARQGTAVIVVTHDQQLAKRCALQARLEQGRLQFQA